MEQKIFVDFKLPTVPEKFFRDQVAVGKALAQRFAAILGPLHHNKVAMINYVSQNGLSSFLIKTDETRPQFELMMPGTCDGQGSQHWRLTATCDARWNKESLERNLKEIVTLFKYWL